MTRAFDHETLAPKFTVPANSHRCLRVLFMRTAGVIVSPRPTLEPGDLVTPSQAAFILGVPPSTVRTWIERNGVKPLGTLGRWPAYDYNDIAAIDAAMRRRREAREAA